MEGFHGAKVLRAEISSVRQINHLLEKADNCIYFGRLCGTTGRTENDNQTLNFMSKNNTSLLFLHH